MSFAASWMDLENLMLSKKRKTNILCHTFHLSWGKGTDAVLARGVSLLPEGSPAPWHVGICSLSRLSRLESLCTATMRRLPKAAVDCITTLCTPEGQRGEPPS